MIGRVFLGRYEVQRLLGEGGMGRVYLARQTDLGRQVVIKVMHDHVAQDARFRERFQRETLLMARFHHPSAVTLYDATLNDPAGPCIVMEYVKGVNLETLLAKTGRMAAPRVARIIGQLCEVLQAAHAEGIIHRDLKPANLMIVEPDTPKERVKVMDFGLAKLTDDHAAQKVTDTNVDFAVGTPGYIAPEQVRGETMDHRGDLYSVGVMMYELLTGRLPFVGANSMDVLLAHATERPPTFAEVGLRGRIPASVERLVMDVLAKSPEDRPQCARDLAERLDLAVHDERLRLDGFGGARPAAEPIPLETDSQYHRRPGTPGPAAPGPRTPAPELAAPAVAAALLAPLASDVAAPDPGAVHYQMDAWMPEAIAIRKLRGFVHDCSGEVLESTPGLVRVRLDQGRTPTAALSWLGFGRRAGGPIDLELHLSRADPRHDSKLSIDVQFRPSHGSLLADAGWRDRCTKIFIELRAYLMGGS